MNPNAAAIVALAQQEAGDRYVYGAEVNLHDPNPPGPFDCSELVQWATAIAGVSPPVPDGSANQLAHCRSHGTLIAINEGIVTAGALLFIQTPREKHVVISRGDGTTIEARGRAFGVGNFPATRRPWTHAARIPGVDYSQHPAPTPREDDGAMAWDDDEVDAHIQMMHNIEDAQTDLQKQNDKTNELLEKILAALANQP